MSRERYRSRRRRGVGMDRRGVKRHARFCPRKKFLCRYRAEPLDRVGLIAAVLPLSSSSFPILLRNRRRKRMSRFESRNARYASADINERGGDGGAGENGNSRAFRPSLPLPFHPEKRGFGKRIVENIESSSTRPSPSTAWTSAIPEQIDRFYIYVYIYM